MSLTKQSKYSWRFQCMVHGKRYSKTYRTINETKAEVQKKFLEWKIMCDKDLYRSSNYTFEQFANIWLEEYCTGFSPIVLKNYKCNLKNWILPELGAYKLEQITPLVLDSFINRLKNSKTKFATRANKELSNGSIEKIYTIVRTIITTAFRKDLIDKNPCLKVSLNLRKHADNQGIHYYDVDTYRQVIDLLEKEETPNAFVVEFAIKTGLRRSEIFGLKWEDIDLENCELRIARTLQKVDGKMIVLPCKTTSSIRKISFPRSLVEKLSKLEKHQYVFQEVDYDNVTAWFRKWQRKNNIPRIKFHDLRHSHATLLLYKGIDIKTISERLGHSNIGTTMNVYTHVMQELDTKAANAIDEI